MFKRILIILAVAAALVGISAVPAQAIVNDCTTGRFCVWKNAYFTGLPDYYWTVAGGSGGYCVEFGGTLNDNIDSAVIKHGSQNPRSVTLYEHAGCSGTPVYFLAPTVHGGPQAGSAHDSGTDNWAPNWSLPGKLPSSAWIIRG